MEDHAALEIVSAQRRTGAQQSGRGCRFVEVEFAVALVGGDDEIMLVGQGDQLLQCFQRDQRAGGVAGRAEEQDLRALPDGRRHGIEIGVETIFGQAGKVMRGGASQERGTFVDLIEGIGAEHQRIGRALDHRLGEGEQRFARAIDRQYLARWIESTWPQVETALAPTGDSLAQGGYAEGGRVDRQLIQVVGQRLRHEFRRAMLGFADGQRDGALVFRWLHAREQGAELFEGVGLQAGQVVIHGNSSRRSVSAVAGCVVSRCERHRSRRSRGARRRPGAVRRSGG